MVKPFVLQIGFEKAIMKGKEGGRMYRTANEYYKEKYGEKVYKLSLDGGFTCPNRDGSVSTGAAFSALPWAVENLPNMAQTSPNNWKRPRNGLLTRSKRENI